MPDHPELAEVEGDEHPDDVELDQPGRLGVEDLDQHDGHHGEEDDAVAVGEPIPARAERARREPVLGQDRAEHGEAVERGVGGEYQDHAGDRDDQVEARAEVMEDRLRDLGDDRALVETGRQWQSVEREPVHVVGIDVAQAHLFGQHDDADHHRDRDHPEQQQGGRGVLALGALEGRHTVGDRLHPGERRTARGEGACEQEEQTQRRQGVVVLSGRGRDRQVGALDVGEVTDRELEETVGAHPEDRDHEEVRRGCEDRAGLPDPAQVDGHQNDHQQGREVCLVTDQGRDRAAAYCAPDEIDTATVRM